MSCTYEIYSEKSHVIWLDNLCPSLQGLPEGGFFSSKLTREGWEIPCCGVSYPVKFKDTLDASGLAYTPYVRKADREAGTTTPTSYVIFLDQLGLKPSISHLVKDHRGIINVSKDKRPGIFFSIKGNQAPEFMANYEQS